MELRLPSEYQEVEYIENTGTQYIITDLLFPKELENPKIEWGFMQIAVPSGDNMVFGYWSNGSIYFEVYNSTALSYASIGKNHYDRISNANLTKDMFIAGVMTKETMYLNGYSYATNAEDTIDQSVRPMAIFAWNSSSGRTYTNKGVRIYYLRFFDGNTKMADYVPCYRKSDGEIGMYDTVTKTFYTNSGTDTFLKGADITRYIDNVSVLDTRRRILLNTPHIDTSVGDLVTFNTDLSAPLKSCKVSFLPVQEGEGDPSPDNVRNITGWNGVRVGLPSEYQEVEWIQSTERKQFILLPYGFEETDTVTITASIDTEYTRDKFIIAPATWNNNNNRFAMVGVYGGVYCIGYGNHTTNYTRLEPMTNNNGNMHTWTFANKIFEITDLGLSIDVSNITFGGITSNLKLFYGYNSNINGKLSYYKHVKLNGEVYEFIPCYRKSDGEIGLYDIKNHVFYTNDGTGSFLKGKDVNNITTNINWTDDVGTVYGGYVDLVSGELVEEWHSITFDGENIKVNRDYMNTGDTDYIKAYWVYFSPTGISNTYCKCNTLKITYTHNKSYIPQTPCLFLSGNGETFGGLILGKKEDYPELAEGTAQDRIDAINNWFKENPTQVVYKLKDPIHYQLTPQQLLTLKGTNNIYSNTNGQTEIKYWKH